MEINNNNNNNEAYSKKNYKYYFDILPNETILEIFVFLDAKSLVTAYLVCKQWNQLIKDMEYFLWKKQCLKNKFIGEETFKVLELHSSIYGWKKTYFWLETDLMKITKSEEEINSEAEKIEEDEYKRRYIYAKGLDIWPNSPILLIYYADFLVERPNRNNSWNIACSFYQKAIRICETLELNSLKKKQEIDENQNINNEKKIRQFLLIAIHHYAHFLIHNIQSYKEADIQYKKLIKLLPGNSWCLERYAEFLYERCYKYNLAEKIYRMSLNIAPSGSLLISYAIFLWQIRGNILLASKCFKVACEIDMEKYFFFANFFGRELKDEQTSKELLANSKLSSHVEKNPNDEQALFSLGLAYHQIHCVDQAEEMYRRHLKITEKPNVCTLSNLAELLIHSRFQFDEAEKLYHKGLSLCCGYHETIEVGLAGLYLARGERERGLNYLSKLLNSSHIISARNTFTEGWILMYIHCYDDQKYEALKKVKQQLVTYAIRPKLILMFDANLQWAKNNVSPEEYNYMKKICSIYNCECDINVLDGWKEWDSIIVEPTPIDKEEICNQELHKILGFQTNNDNEDNIEEENP